MSHSIVPYSSAHLGGVRALLREASLASQYDVMAQPGGFEESLADPWTARECTCVGLARGRVVGFGMTFVLPMTGGGAWTAIRLGVSESFRRRGLGSAILEHTLARLATLGVPGGIGELGLSAFVPNPAAEAFAAHHGFQHARWFWRMERATAPAPEPGWPSGIELRMYDDSERARADWNDAYNDSFAEHYHFVPSTLESLRQRLRSPDVLADGILLAYREGRCVGFCRNERLHSTGVVGALGTVRAARGIGLGRAMLRWAVASFGARGFPRIGLMVDGENEGALALYRSEGFEIARTRRLWSRSPAWAAR